jgi:uncharacterized protein YwgA
MNNMNNVLSVIKTIQQSVNSPPCKKTVHKITYLIQEADKERVFDFSMHLYGPYSAELDSEIRYLCDCGSLDISNTKNRGHKISVSDSIDVPDIDPTALRIINVFSSKSPADLELLATALYVKRALPDASDAVIVDGVIKIKGVKYSSSQIVDSLQKLKKEGYF